MLRVSILGVFAIYSSKLYFKRLRGAGLLLFGILASAVVFMSLAPNSALAANPTTINFQGKVVRNDSGNQGINVTDGSYNFIFRIYDTSAPTLTGTCAANASCWWEETDTLTVTNGVFQVELGAVCALTSACNSSHSGIDFSTNNSLYLTMKFGSDTAFMSPLIHLNSVPFAFNADNASNAANADKLGGKTAADFVQLSPTAGQTIALTGGGFVIQDAANPNEVSGNLFEVQNNAGTATYLGVSSTGISVETAANIIALALDTGSTTPHLKIYGGSGTDYADIYYDDATSTAYYGASSGTAVLGSGSGPISLIAGSGAGITITANAASTWKTTAGNLTLQGGSGIVSLGTSTSLTASGNYSLVAGAGSVLTVTSNAAATWSTSAGNLTLQAGAALILTAGGDDTITIGSGSNYVSFAASTREPTLNGLARHKRYIKLSAEYPGATLTGDGSGNTGTMTTDNTTSNTSPAYMNYYDWTSTTAGNDYDIWLRIPVPEDFSDWWAGNTGTIKVYTTSSTDAVIIGVYDTTNPALGSPTCQTNVITTTGWQTDFPCNFTNGTYTTGGSYFMMRITMRVGTANDHVRVGDITIPYLSKW